jgi:hypothetical protein
VEGSGALASAGQANTRECSSLGAIDRPGDHAVKHCLFGTVAIGCAASSMLLDPGFHSKPGRPKKANRAFLPGWLLFLWLAGWYPLLTGGCAATGKDPTTLNRPFVFHRDTFAYANQLVWDYEFDDETGRTTHHPHQPPPTYTHHCFVVAKSARQFFQNARFDPAQSTAGESTYRHLVRRILTVDPARTLSAEEKVVIPGYADLFSFSRDWESLLKEECGGAWHSYFQRGHWRMILPFSRRHQEEMAGQLVADLKANRPPVVHLVRFPSLKINHAVLVFSYSESATEIRFQVYDPNTPEAPSRLTYHRPDRKFTYPRSHSFAGGLVNVYEIYRSWNY